VPIWLLEKPSADAADDHPIYARSGWRIPQPPREKIPVMTLELMRSHARDWLSWRRGIILRSVSPHPYNCVGMIFAARRAFIDLEHIYDILREDEYRKITLAELVVGDVVLYRNYDEPSHVALVTQVDTIGQTRNVRVLSKWGFDPEFEHFMEQVPPSMGRPVEFYTERVE